MFFEARSDGSEMFKLVEEAFDEVSETIEIWAECRKVDAPGHRLDVGPGAAIGQSLAQGVAVISAVGEQGLAIANAAQHIGGAAAVVSLARGEFERDRIAVGVDDGVDFGGQPASRAPHALGSRQVPSGGAGGFLRTPFLTLAAC